MPSAYPQPIGCYRSQKRRIARTNRLHERANDEFAALSEEEKRISRGKITLLVLLLMLGEFCGVFYIIEQEGNNGMVAWLSYSLCDGLVVADFEMLAADGAGLGVSIIGAGKFYILLIIAGMRIFLLPSHRECDIQEPRGSGMSVKKCIWGITDRVVGRFRRCYLWRNRLRLKNISPTIIASDCFGGRVYHSLGLRFMSPTINLWFKPMDFIKFVRNIKGYMESEVCEVLPPHKEADILYPVGKISCEGEEIRLYFMHYSSFDEARNKWNERKCRVDYSNIYVLQIAPSVTDELIEAFDALPIKNKMLLTNANLTNSPNVVTHSVFSKSDYRPGEVLQYKSRFSLKRYIDDVDYVSFLNRPQ